MRRINAFASWKLETLEKEDGPWKKDVHHKQRRRHGRRLLIFSKCDVAMQRGSLKDLKEMLGHGEGFARCTSKGIVAVRILIF